MKKLINTIMVILALVCFSSITFAANKEDVVNAKRIPPAVAQCAIQLIGSVVSIDKATNEVAIQDQQDGMYKAIVIQPNDINIIS